MRSIFVLASAATLGLGGVAGAAVTDILADVADTQIRSGAVQTGAPLTAGNFRVGYSNSTTGTPPLNTLVFSGIYPFKLPTLAALGATSAAEIQSASIGFAVTSVTGNLIGTPGGDAPNFGIDAFALTSTRTSADVLTGDDSAASTLIAADILTASPLVPSAANTRNVVESASLLSLLQSLYTSDPTLGDDDFLFIRLSPNGGTVGSNMGYNVASANNGVAQPLLTIAIPEPASLSMLAMGGLLLRRRRLD